MPVSRNANYDLDTAEQELVLHLKDLFKAKMEGRIT